MSDALSERKPKNPGWPSLKSAIRERANADSITFDKVVYDLANAVEVTPRAIKSYIYGEKTPETERLVEICRFLKVDEIKLRTDSPLPPVFFAN